MILNWFVKNWARIDFLNKILIPLCITIFGIWIALLVDRMRLPNLEIIAGEKANSDNEYPNSHPHGGERWKFFRVLVRNKPMPLILRWLPRETAENCRAVVKFKKDKDKKDLFTIKGRWSSTPEIPHLSQENRLLKTLHPDPVTIPCDNEEFLDIIAKCDRDEEAYAWNNEAYFEEWRPSKYKLEKGNYRVSIYITTQNGKSFVKKFKLIIGDNIEDTSLE